YAEISSVIHEFTLKNENSVSDLWAIIDLISNNDYDTANSNLKIYNQKWNEISRNCSTSSSSNDTSQDSDDTFQ
ncbi:hypothetical protein CL637_003440, partial [bacterium]|nr:hypothetical protein [bacterium]